MKTLISFSVFRKKTHFGASRQQDFHFRVNYPVKVKYVFHVIVGNFVCQLMHRTMSLPFCFITTLRKAHFSQTSVLKLQYQKSINRFQELQRVLQKV